MQSISFAGRLGQDPESRQAGDTVVTLLKVAVNDRIKHHGEWQDHTEWFRVVVFGKRAVWLSENLRKGAVVAVKGKQRTSSYEDREGAKRYKTEILADDVTPFLERRGGSDDFSP